jgi:hypothetical protein
VQTINASAPVGFAGLNISPSSGRPRTPVNVSGGGLTPGENVNVFYRTGLASPARVRLCSAVADTVGGFACTGHIPVKVWAGSGGPHRIIAFGSTSGIREPTAFTLLPVAG